MGLEEQGEELCHESGERELTGTVAFGREVPPTHGDSMIEDRGIDILTSLCSCSLTSCHCLSLTECNRIQVMRSPLMPPRASGRGEKMESGFEWGKWKIFGIGQGL